MPKKYMNFTEVDLIMSEEYMEEDLRIEAKRIIEDWGKWDSISKEYYLKQFLVDKGEKLATNEEEKKQFQEDAQNEQVLSIVKQIAKNVDNGDDAFILLNSHMMNDIAFPAHSLDINTSYKGGAMENEAMKQAVADQKTAIDRVVKEHVSAAQAVGEIIEKRTAALKGKQDDKQDEIDDQDEEYEGTDLNQSYMSINNDDESFDMKEPNLNDLLGDYEQDNFIKKEEDEKEKEEEIKEEIKVEEKQGAGFVVNPNPDPKKDSEIVPEAAPEVVPVAAPIQAPGPDPFLTDRFIEKDMKEEREPFFFERLIVLPADKDSVKNYVKDYYLPKAEDTHKQVSEYSGGELADMIIGETLLTRPSAKNGGILEKVKTEGLRKDDLNAANKKIDSMRLKILSDESFQKTVREGGEIGSFYERYKQNKRKELTRRTAADKDRDSLRNAWYNDQKIKLNDSTLKKFENLRDQMLDLNNNKYRAGLNDDMVWKLKGVIEKAQKDELEMIDLVSLQQASAKYYAGRKGRFFQPFTDAGKDRLQVSADIYETVNGAIGRFVEMFNTLEEKNISIDVVSEAGLPEKGFVKGKEFILAPNKYADIIKKNEEFKKELQTIDFAKEMGKADFQEGKGFADKLLAIGKKYEYLENDKSLNEQQVKEGLKKKNQEDFETTRAHFKHIEDKTVRYAAALYIKENLAEIEGQKKPDGSPVKLQEFYTKLIHSPEFKKAITSQVDGKITPEYAADVVTWKGDDGKSKVGELIRKMDMNDKMKLDDPQKKAVKQGKAL